MTEELPGPGTQDITVGDKARAIRDVAAYRPTVSGSIVALSILAGVLEGIGLSFILPIISLVQGGTADSVSGPAGQFVEAYSALGVPFTLEYVVAGVGLVIASRFAVSFLVSWLTALLVADYERTLRLTGFESTLDARVSYIDRQGSETLLNAILTQTSHASGMIAGFVRLLELAVVCVAYVSVALYVAPVLTVLTGSVFVGLMFVSRYGFESGFDVGERIADANERVQGAVQAGIFGIREVKLFGLDDELEDEFRRAVDVQANTAVKQQRDMAAIGNVNQFLGVATIFALIYVGTSFTSLSLASLGVFLFAMFRLAPLLSNLNGTLYSVDNELPHLVRTQAFIDRLRQNREASGGEPVGGRVGSVAFDSVEFTYPGEPDGVLRDVSFSVERGEFVAFVGPSGAGKSTIVSLLAGLYSPDSGAVLVDGVPVEDLDLDAWRSRVAIVEQDPHVFNETLRYNLTIGNRDVSDAAVEAACDTAEVTEFLEDLPDGLDTVLGDDGVRLSGGQRQRVAIARALLKDADVLVLDEATSELDSHLEARVHAGIEALDADYAVVAIAHRLSTVTGADTIHVLEDGEIVESGTHEGLLGEDGEYSDLYRAQVGRSTGARVGVGE